MPDIKPSGDGNISISNYKYIQLSHFSQYKLASDMPCLASIILLFFRTPYSSSPPRRTTTMPSCTATLPWAGQSGILAL